MLYAVIIAVIGFLTAIIFMFWLIMLKRDLKKVNSDLKLITQTSTNKKLTSLSFDRDVCLLENSVNDLLAKQKQIFIESDRLNNEFKSLITNISHDLRTPLTAALGYIQILKTNGLSAEKKSEYFIIVENKLAALTTLIDELFEFALITESIVFEKLEKINIFSLLRTSLLLFYEDYERVGFEIVTDISEIPFYMICNESSLKRVFQNLLKNILMYAEKKVNITATPTGIITFKNDVKNIDIDIDKLFNRFYTADLSRNTKSTGLGLAIVKNLTESMGGKIGASFDNEMLTIIIDFSK